jgi:hypothetical protein
MPQDLADFLEQTIVRELPNLQAIDEQGAGARLEGAGAWSRREELGHLIDSAANNHIRFVRATIEPEFRGTGYDQEAWVRLHGYDDLPWSILIDFWQRYNSLLVHLVSRVPEERLNTRCIVGESAPVTLRFLIEDYVLHMQHHLDHILHRDIVTQYPGAAVGV